MADSRPSAEYAAEIVISDADDPQAKGIFLNDTLVQWLSTARASIDIDQYILLDPEPESGLS